MIQISLPYPPASGNTTTRHTKSGIHYTKPEIKTYRDHVRLIVQREGVDTEWLSEKDGIECVVEIFPPDLRRRDMDNVFKCVGDACTRAGVWHDDYQIDRLILIRKEPIKYGLVRLTASVIRKEQ